MKSIPIKTRNLIRFVVGMLTFFYLGCISNQKLKCEIKVIEYLPSGFPRYIEINFVNNTNKMVTLYDLSERFSYFWEAVIIKNDSINEYLIRYAKPWVEPELISLNFGEKLIDTVVFNPGQFFLSNIDNVNCTPIGCTPFINGGKLSLKYVNDGKFPKGVLVENPERFKNRGYLGVINSNEIYLGKIDDLKLNNEFTDTIFGIKMVNIQSKCECKE